MTSLGEAKQTFAEHPRWRCTGRSVSNKNDVLWAVERAYIDAMPRTVRGHGEIPRNKLNNLRSEATEAFCTYFNGEPPTNLEAFEKIHRALCNEHFLMPYNKLLNEFGAAEQQYGKAQKVINMAFKYLSCFDDADTYKDHFVFCHMPIDSVILAWCREHCGISGTVSWSNIRDFEYYAFQNFIRNWLAAHAENPAYDSLPEKPLEAEFVIWHEAAMS